MLRKASALLLCALMTMTCLFSLAGATPASGAASPSATVSAGGSVILDTGEICHYATKADIETMKSQLLSGSDILSPVQVRSDLYRATGLLDPSEEELESLEGRILIFDGYASRGPATAASCDLSAEPYFPIIGDQGAEGACAAFATIYYNFGYLEARDNDWSDAYLGNQAHLLSPQWAFNKVVLSGGGSYIDFNALVARDVGVCTWAEMPFVEGDTVSWGSEAAWRNAPLHKLDEVVYRPYSGAATIDSFKAALLSGHPITIALDATPINVPQTAFADGNFILSSLEYSSSRTNHAVTIVGYDDSVSDDGDVGAFKIVNSWGADWGEDGHFWMTYNAVEEVGNLLQAISLVDKDDYQPTALAVMHFDLAPFKEGTIEVQAVRVSDGAVMSQVELFHYGSQPSRMPAFMCLDISSMSAYIADPLYQVRLVVGDPAEYGTLSSFRLELCSEPYVEGKAVFISAQAAGLPLSTPASASTQLFASLAVDIPEALSFYDGAFSFSGNARWVGVRNVEGRSACMQSGDVGDSSYSAMVASFHGPGTLSYDWKVSSEIGYDFLRIYVDGILSALISGETVWTTRSLTLTSGYHQVTWAYEKDDGISRGNDCCWIDNVNWNGASTLFYENFEVDSNANAWNAADGNSASGNDYWGPDGSAYWSGRSSLWCAASGTGANDRPNYLNQYYDENMDAYAYVALPAFNGATAKLSFAYTAYTGTYSLADYAYVRVNNGEAWTTLWTQPSAQSDWDAVQLTLPSDARYLAFLFHSDGTVALGPYPGVFIDDVLITALDTSAPSSQVTSADAFTRGAGVNLVTEASDAGASGVAFVRIYYRFGTTGSYNLYALASNPSGQFAPGETYVDFADLIVGGSVCQFYTIAVDRAGNTEAAPLSPDAVTTIDITPPQTAASTDGRAAPLWNSGPVTVTLTSEDDLSGVASVSYAIDDQPFQSYEGPFLISAHGMHTIRYYAVDAVGNREDVSELQVFIDLTDPTASAFISGTRGDNGWFIGDATITIGAVDADSGVAVVRYRIDSGPWTDVSGPIIINADGAHLVEIYAVDNAGNEDIIRSFGVMKDTQAPSSSAALDGPGNPALLIFNGTVSVQLSATDPTSGAASIWYALDGGAYVEYDGILPEAAEGAHTIAFYALDGAGNREEARTIEFLVDLHAPEISVDSAAVWGQDPWALGPVSVTASCSDALSESGIRYRLDGSAWMTWPGYVVITGDGIHEIEMYAVDLAGNEGVHRRMAFSIDTALPRISAASDGAVSPAWNGRIVNVNLTAADDTSGVFLIEYRVDAGDWTEYHGTIILSDTGIHTVQYRVTDVAGNQGAAGHLSVLVDRHPPTSSVHLDGRAGSSGWFLGDVLANISASDLESGMGRITYRLDGGDWTDYAGGIVIGEGNHTLEFRAIDALGNTEAIRSSWVQVDKTAPATTMIWSGDAVQGSLLFRSAPTLTLRADDGGSGRGLIEYSIDDGGWLSYSVPVLISGDGSHQLRVRAYDLAGNLGPVQSTTMRVDSTAPTSTVRLEGTAGANGWYRSHVSVFLSAVDAGSGLKNISYRLDGGEWVTASDLEITASGTHLLEYRAADNATNVEGIRSVQIKIDTGAPSATISLLDGAVLSANSLDISVSPADGGSGLASVEYSLDGGNFIPLSTNSIHLSDLASGKHTLAIRIVDQAGNPTLQETTFTVTSSSTADSSMIIILVLVLLAAIGGAAGFLVWRKRAKK